MPIHSVSCLAIVEQSILDILLSGPKDPIPLHHFGLKEIKAKVDLMEDQFDCPMLFDPALIPDPAVAGQNVSAWGQGVAVYGAAKGFKHPRTMPTLMSSMYGFECEEEMDDTKKYLLAHGGYQLEQVSLPIHSHYNVLYYLTIRYISYVIDLPIHTVSCLLTICRSTVLRAYLPIHQLSYLLNNQSGSSLPII